MYMYISKYMAHYFLTNLEPRHGLWLPICLLLCSAAPVARGFETSAMPLRSPVLRLRRCCLIYHPAYLACLVILLPICRICR